MKKVATGFLPVLVVTQAVSQITGPYERLRISGEAARNGIYDPSVEYNRDGTVGWLVYSAIEGNHPVAGPFVHTRLARSIDHGKTWSYVKTINRSHNSELTWIDGSLLPGVWRYEVPAFVLDPDDKGREWKLFSHRYFW